MLYKVILALLMSLELVVVLISLKYLHQSNVISKEFAAIFGSSREEVKKLYNGTEKLDKKIEKSRYNIS